MRYKYPSYGCCSKICMSTHSRCLPADRGTTWTVLIRLLVHSCCLLLRGLANRSANVSFAVEELSINVECYSLLLYLGCYVGNEASMHA